MLDQVQLEAITSKALLFLKQGEEQRETVQRYVERVATQVLIRCNRKDIPAMLDTTIAQLAEDMIRVDNAVPGLDEKEVASISRGDTSIHYRERGQALQNVDAFLRDYDSLLVRYKRPNIPRCKDERS